MGGNIPRHGKPHPEQDQIGKDVRLGEHCAARVSFPGRLLEVFGDKYPRGMIVHDRTRLIDSLPLFLFPLVLYSTELTGIKIGSGLITVKNQDEEFTGAAVDLGSNTFHLVIATIQLPRIRVIDRIREPVRLSSGLDVNYCLDDESQARALACLERFGERLRDFPATKVRAVATSALRQAGNAEFFMKRARQALGHRIQVISGYEEARLIYTGVNHRLEGSTRRRLVIDIGGGSTELIIGEGGDPKKIESFAVGALNTVIKFFPEGRVTQSSMNSAVLAVELRIQAYVPALLDCGWESVVGSSGSVLAVAEVIAHNEFGGLGITYCALKKVRDLLIDLGHVTPSDFPYLNPDRAFLLAGGVAVLLALFKYLRFDAMDITEGGIRDGVLLDIVGRSEQRDIRSTSVRQMAERYEVDFRQVSRVKNKAMILYAMVKQEWEIDGAEWALLLQWAAELHEVGLAVSHARYHRHSAYIVENSYLAGFSMGQQVLLSFLLRAHRRKFPLAEWQALPNESQLSMLRMSVLLRLAVLLCRGRVKQPPRIYRLEIKKTSIRVSFAPGWLDDNPLTAADLEQEESYLLDTGYTLTHRDLPVSLED